MADGSNAIDSKLFHSSETPGQPNMCIHSVRGRFSCVLAAVYTSRLPFHLYMYFIYHRYFVTDAIIQLWLRVQCFVACNSRELREGALQLHSLHLAGPSILLSSQLHAVYQWFCYPC